MYGGGRALDIGILSPRPGTPGRGVGGEGFVSSPIGTAVYDWFVPRTPNPPPRSTGARGAERRLLLLHSFGKNPQWGGSAAGVRAADGD
jgi:hypothetical protein